MTITFSDPLLDEPTKERTQEFFRRTYGSMSEDDGNAIFSLVRQGIDINAMSQYETTPLFEAVHWAFTPLVTLLLEHPDIQVNTVCRDGTPLYIALDNAAHTEKAQFRSPNPSLSIHHAVNIEKVRLLLAREDTDVNMRNKNGNAPVHCIAYTNSTEVANLLFQRKDVDVNARDNNGVTPIYLAMEYKKQEVMRLLLNHGANIYVHPLKDTPLPPYVTTLMKQRDDFQSTHKPLRTAEEFYHMLAVWPLTEEGLLDRQTQAEAILRTAHWKTAEQFDAFIDSVKETRAGNDDPIIKAIVSTFEHIDHFPWNGRQLNAVQREWRQLVSGRRTGSDTNKDIGMNDP